MTISPPRVRSARELLLDDLKRLLTVETTLAKVILPKLLQEVQDDELRSALQQHHEETKQHVENVKKAFEEFGEDASGKDAPALDGLKEEHDSRIANVAPELRDSFDAGSAIGTEHYEIAIYSTALLLAQSVGLQNVANFLRNNLDQEFVALKKLETISERLAQSRAG